MKLAGTYTIETTPEHAYALLQDPDVLARCIPGCDKLVRTGDGSYEMQMKLLVASISGAFNGNVRLSAHEPPHRFRMDVDGSGKIGFMKGGGVISLSPKDRMTDVSYEGEVHLGGTIASVGQRLVDTTSKMLLKRFFSKLSEIARSGGAEAASG